MELEGTKFEENPIEFRDTRVEALEEAMELFKSILSEYAESHDLSEDQIVYIKSLLRDVYIEKKASYFLESKIRKVSNQINNICSNALFSSVKPDQVHTKFFYLNHTNHLVTNE